MQPSGWKLGDCTPPKPIIMQLELTSLLASAFETVPTSIDCGPLHPLSVKTVGDVMVAPCSGIPKFGVPPSLPQPATAIATSRDTPALVALKLILAPTPCP